MHFALKHPLPLFAVAAVASIVGGLCVGAFPVCFADLLSAIGLSTTPTDDTTSVVLYAIRAPRVLAAFCVGAALAAGGAALQSLFRNPLADPGLLGVSSGAALAAVSVIVLGERVMHVIPPDLRPWLLPVAAFGGGLVATTIVYRLAAREGVTLIGTLLLAGIAINAVTSAGSRVRCAGPSNRRTMCGAIRPTKPTVPEIATPAPCLVAPSSCWPTRLPGPSSRRPSCRSAC